MMTPGQFKRALLRRPSETAQQHARRLRRMDLWMAAHMLIPSAILIVFLVAAIICVLIT